MAAAQHTVLDPSNESSTMALLGASVGDINRPFYLAHFARFEAAQRPHLSWNWAAALATLNWLLFRQMWQAACLYLASVLGLGLCFFGLGKLVFDFSPGMQWGLAWVFLGMSVIVPGAGANALYYLASVQRVQVALSRHETTAQACAQLAQQASSRKGLVLLCVANVVVAVLAIQSYAVLTRFAPLQTVDFTLRPLAASSGTVAKGQAQELHTAPAPPAPTLPPAAQTPPPAPEAPGAAPTATVPPAATAARTTPAPSAAASTPPERTAPVLPAHQPMRSAAAVQAAREVAQANREAARRAAPASAP